MKKQNRNSLKWKLSSTMLLYWVLPFLVIIGTIGIYILTSQAKNQMDRLVAQMELNTKTCEERLMGAVADSRQATYDGILYDKYRQYKKGKVNERGFYMTAQIYLDKQYSHRKNNSVAILMLREDPLNKKYTTYNFSTGGSYQQLQTFFTDDSEEILSNALELDTAVGFVRCGNRLYIVRNMMDRNFNVWAVLVNRINTDYCFETIMNYEEDFAIRMDLDQVRAIDTGKTSEWSSVPAQAFEQKKDYVFQGNRVYSFCETENSDFRIRLTLNTKRRSLFTPLYGYLYIILVMLFCLIPMLYLFFRLAKKYLSVPIEDMMESAAEIENGNLGYQMEASTGSTEFEYLRESMNHMSERLKYQFDHIYEEELALRDAKIMALQSHINPHFMNNTLEIINWEARLSGNEKVSKMIESLSTLMDAAIDRRNLPEVRLSEEMAYVHAYLYITCERLGKRLTVITELPDEIMNLKVPRLIMQPIIENAIEHGIVPRGSGCVWIRGRREENYLYLEIINDGAFTDEDEQRVQRLLDQDYDASRESSGSMGIANVNQRLRILYGENCGLSIHKCEEQKTISTLTIFVLD